MTYRRMKGYGSPEHKFRLQRNGAKYRGIEWRLTFDEWMGIWQESGHWHERGRTDGCYVMARHGDVGPYAADNVSIIPCNKNHSDANRRVDPDLPLGVYRNWNCFIAVRRRQYLGSFKTVELAHAAYINAGEQRAA